MEASELDPEMTRPRRIAGPRLLPALPRHYSKMIGRSWPASEPASDFRIGSALDL
jgi:hypothetical protein